MGLTRKACVGVPCSWMTSCSFLPDDGYICPTQVKEKQKSPLHLDFKARCPTVRALFGLETSFEREIWQDSLLGI